MRARRRQRQRRGRGRGDQGAPRAYDELNMKLGDEMTPEAMDKPWRSKGACRTARRRQRGTSFAAGVAMDAPRCPPPDADVSTLSGGERRRVALCRLLSSHSDLLPSTNRPTISTPNTARAERFLKEYKGTVVAVTHDRTSSITRRSGSSSLDRGLHPWKGNHQWLIRSSAARARGEVREQVAGATPPASSSGSVCRLAPGSRKARRDSTPTNNCSTRTRRRRSNRSKSTSCRTRLGTS